MKDLKKKNSENDIIINNTHFKVILLSKNYSKLIKNLEKKII